MKRYGLRQTQATPNQEEFAENASRNEDVIRAALALRNASAGAFSTSNGIVYSYSLPIGNLQFGNGPYYVLDKRKSPSVTTSKHIGYLMRGLPSREIVVVDDVLAAAEHARGGHTPNAIVSGYDDPFYIVQGMYEDSRLAHGEFGSDDEGEAIEAAKRLLRDDLLFQGDVVRVITRDGELVWGRWRDGREYEYGEHTPNGGLPCECGREGSWRGAGEGGRRVFLCDECWRRYRATPEGERVWRQWREYESEFRRHKYGGHTRNGYDWELNASTGDHVLKPNARATRLADARPTDAHLEHPAFNGVIGGLRDANTGIRVLFVDYDEDNPLYEGGQWIEVYDDNDELLEMTPAPERPAPQFLEAALSAAVAEYGED